MTTLDFEARWDLVDALTSRTVRYGKYRHTLTDALSELTVSPLTGIPFAIGVLYGFWYFFGAFAGWFTDGVFVKLFDNEFLPWVREAWPTDPDGLIYYIMVGTNDPTVGTALESFGVLTSGLFVAIGIVLPAIIAFYLFLIIMEDTGYIPRLAVLVDSLLHKVGLHGFAIVPMILSLGCNTPAVMASRNLETGKQRFMMIALLSVFIPCGAQIAVMQEFVPQYVGYVLLFLLICLFISSFLLSRIIPGETPEILIDVPPYRRPSWSNIGAKLWVRTRHFLLVAIPFVLFGVAMVNVLYYTDVMGSLQGVFGPVLTGWFGVPDSVVESLVAGFFRKDLPIALLGDAGLSTAEMITSVIVVSLYFPCVATFVMVLREGYSEGAKGLVKYLFGTLAFLFAMVFLWGGLIRLILELMGVD